jgi:(E)-4-hydroxy-3-methylbut-2-enyl-diphosphate synthase
LVESALNSVKLLEDEDFREFKISVKASDVFLAVAAYQGLAEACDYPLHIGITEAGGLRTGTVKSSIGIGMLLWAGIGDTIRVSLSADPVEEIKVGFDLPPAVRCDRDRAGSRRTPGPYHHAHDGLGDRLCGQRPG